MKIDADLRSFLRALNTTFETVECAFDSCDTVKEALRALKQGLPYELDVTFEQAVGRTALRAFVNALPFYSIATPPLRLLNSWSLDTMAYSKGLASLLEKQFNPEELPYPPEVARTQVEVTHRVALLGIDVAISSSKATRDVYDLMLNEADEILKHVREKAPEQYYAKLSNLQYTIATGGGRGGQDPARFATLAIFPGLHREVVETTGSVDNLLALTNGVLGVSADDVDPSS